LAHPVDCCHRKIVCWYPFLSKLASYLSENWILLDNSLNQEELTFGHIQYAYIHEVYMQPKINIILLQMVIPGKKSLTWYIGHQYCSKRVIRTTSGMVLSLKNNRYTGNVVSHVMSQNDNSKTTEYENGRPVTFLYSQKTNNTRKQ